MDKKLIVKIISIIGGIAAVIGAYFGLDIHLTAKEVATPPAIEQPAPDTFPPAE